MIKSRPTKRAHSDSMPMSRTRLVHELVAAQAEQSPAALALTHGETHLTYAYLNARANQLAHHLRHLGAGPESVVAICTHRSPDLLVAQLAILKAGAAYLPLDPAYPPERLAFILHDA